jgi:hypothetical protein
VSRARRGAALLAAVVLAGAGLVACGGSSGSDDAVPEATIPVASSTGDSCTDVTGDLDLPAGVPAATPGLTGIDLVAASATVVGDQLDVSMTMAGPVDAAPAATYVVAQGDPLGALSFELRMVHGADGWTTTLITWPQAVETRTKVPITPKVDGATLTASVPLEGLPPIALALQFGTSAEVGSALVIDDCSSLSG